MCADYMYPKVSIVMPVYNSEKFLRQALDSIKVQTLRNFELIIINDASTDGSAKIVEQCKYEMDYIKDINLEKNMGVAYVRNLGVSLARGEYVCFIDSDDVIERNFIELMYKTALKYNSDIVCCNYYYIDEKNRKTKNVFSRRQGNYSAKKLIHSLLKDTSMHFFLWNKMFRRRMVEDNRVLFTNRCFEDILFTMKMFYFSDKIYIINIPLYNYRKHSSSITHFMSLSQLKEYILVLKSVKNFLLEKNIYNIYKFNYMYLVFRFLISCFYRIPCIYLHYQCDTNIIKCFGEIFLSIIKLIACGTNF